MKKISFLIRLKNEGKLELVEPSEEISESYLQMSEMLHISEHAQKSLIFDKSESHFEAAKILLEKEKLEESVSMAYYGMYHSLLALLFRCGIKSENHTGSILLLKELFNEIDLAKEISYGKKERIDKQYYTDFKITKLDCRDMIKKAEKFIINSKTVLKHINQEKITQIRHELKDLLEQEK